MAEFTVTKARVGPLGKVAFLLLSNGDEIRVSLRGLDELLRSAVEERRKLQEAPPRKRRTKSP